MNFLDCMVIIDSIDGQCALGYKLLTDDGLIYSIPDKSFIESCKLLDSLACRELEPLDICTMIDHGLIKPEDYENLQEMGLLCEEAICLWEQKESPILEGVSILSESDLDNLITKELLSKIKELINANRKS